MIGRGADYDLLFTLITCLKGVVCAELVPVRLLVLCEHSGAVTQGTHAPKCSNNSRPYEFRPVGYVLYGQSQVIIHLKCDYFLFFLHSLTPCIWIPLPNNGSAYYYFVILIITF